jgi:hypothetical protein
MKFLWTLKKGEVSAMWPFSRKKKVEETPKVIEPRPCQHKYKDFPWYTDGTYNENTKVLDVSIIEPYVCIHCGHRKDVVLDHFSRIFGKFEEAEKFYDDFQDGKYTNMIEKKAVVEDMINDMVLVDRQYIEIYMRLHGEESSKNEKFEVNLSLPG